MSAKVTITQQRFKEQWDAIARIEEAREQLDWLVSAIQEALENFPQNLQESAAYEKLDDLQSEFDSAASECGNLIDSLSELDAGYWPSRKTG